MGIDIRPGHHITILAQRGPEGERIFVERGGPVDKEALMSFRKIAIFTGTIALLVSPAFAQSVQDSNTYPGSVPDTPQAGNLLGQQDFDVTGPTGAILVPVPAPYLGSPGYDPGYDIEGGADFEVPLGVGKEPLEPGPYDPYDPYYQ
jgi:hypothetical protein